MNRLTILLTSFFILLFAFEGFSYNPTLPEAVTAKKAVITQNLISALDSKNEGLMQSAAYYLGEYKCENAVIPLMKLLHSDCCEGLRVMAALSLTKIGTEKSLFAVRQSSIFDHSDFVRKFCLHFYLSATEK
ncbi:MAG: HEAT repeat domain-containing protein [Ignavibacteriaceae bacterium]|nr:HEAT repeat domain-containing protein [Ignavibacteriaceae bacterium]